MGLKHNKYRSKCFGRGACDRRAGGCDIHAAFDSPTGLIRPAMDTGNLTLRTNSTVFEVTVDPKATGKARGVNPSSTAKTARHIRSKRTRGGAGGLDARIGATDDALSKSAQHPNGIGNSSDHVGHNFCEHIMGPA